MIVSFAFRLKVLVKAFYNFRQALYSIDLMANKAKDSITNKSL